MNAVADDRRASFEREILTHLDSMYAFATRLTQDHHAAEDLVSDTVLRAFDHWEQYTLGTNARAWLFTILYRLFVSRLRVEKRETPLPDSWDEGVHHQVVGPSDPEGAWFDSIMDEEVTRAIESLSEGYREAVLLSDVHDFRYAEIAEILGVPEGTVKSRLFRGRQILQQKLLRYAIEMGYVKPRAA